MSDRTIGVSILVGWALLCGLVATTPGCATATATYETVRRWTCSEHTLVKVDGVTVCSKCGQRFEVGK